MKTSHWPLTFFGTIVALLQLVLPIVMVRIFHPDEIGAYKIFFLYLGLLPLLSFSIGLVHGVSFWSGNRERGRELLHQAATMLLGLGALLMALGVAVSPWLAHLFGGSAQRAVLFALAGGLTLINMFFEEVWVVNGRIWQAALYRGSTEIARCAAMLLTAFWLRSIDAVFVVHTLFVFGRFLIGGGLSWRQGFVALVWKAELWRQIWAYALPVSAAGILNAISGSTDQLILSQLLPLGDFALYSLGCLLVPPLFALEQSVNQVMVAKAAREMAAGDSAAAARTYAGGVSELASFMLPSVVGLSVFAEPIVRILFTDEYLAAAPVLRLYAFTYLLASFPADTGPKAGGDGRWALKAFAMKSVVSLILTPLFTWRFGVLGALSAILISSVFLRVIGFSYNIRRLGWSLHDFIPLREIGRISAISLLLGAGCLASAGLFADSRLWFIVCGGVFSVIYSALVLWPRWQNRHG